MTRRGDCLKRTGTWNPCQMVVNAVWEGAPELGEEAEGGLLRRQLLNVRRGKESFRRRVGGSSWWSHCLACKRI